MVNSEDNLVVGTGEEKGFLLLQPLRLLEMAAVGTVTILAGIVGCFPLPAGVALLQIAAQRCRAAAQHIIDRFGLLVAEGVLTAVVIQPVAVAQHLGDAVFGAGGFDLDVWPEHETRIPFEARLSEVRCLRQAWQLDDEKAFCGRFVLVKVGAICFRHCQSDSSGQRIKPFIGCFVESVRGAQLKAVPDFSEGGFLNSPSRPLLWVDF